MTIVHDLSPGCADLSIMGYYYMGEKNKEIIARPERTRDKQILYFPRRFIKKLFPAPCVNSKGNNNIILYGTLPDQGNNVAIFSRAAKY